MTSATENDPKELERLLEMALARISSLEAFLMLMWNDHPRRADIKAQAATLIEARIANDLSSARDEMSLALREQQLRQSFDAVFHELSSEKDRDLLRRNAAPHQDAG